MNNNKRSIPSASALLLAVPLLFGALPPAQAQVSVGVGISLPGVNIGINLPSYPQLVRVPGYPVYYAPSASNNYFFYDGLYWVYADDNWYSSDWYNGPWYLVEPAYVPVYVLRVPVRYYRRPPVYFRTWRADAPPRWGEHWGRDWESRHRGWDRWDRRAVPAPAPLPIYQRNYTGDRYPRAPERQRELRVENYRYQPRETVSRQQYQRPVAAAGAVAPPSREGRPDRADRSDRRGDRPDRQVPPPPRDAQRPQPSDGGQARPQVQPARPSPQADRPQGERPQGQRPPMERPQDRPQAERPNGPPPDRGQGRPERMREQPAQVQQQPRPQAPERMQPPPRPQPERAQAPEPRQQPQERARPQPQPQAQQPQQRGPEPRGEANPGQRGGGEGQGRGGPPEGRGRDKDR